MEKWIKKLSSICLLISTCSAMGQDVPIGTWRTHFSYNEAHLLASGDQKIFCAAENGIFFIDLETNSLNKISKLNGLSDVSATSLAYDEHTQILLIGYGSGLIDLVTKAGVRTIRDINESSLFVEKGIRDIAIHEQLAYMATDFGIVVVSMETREIIETFRSIGPNATDVAVYDLEIFGDMIYAVTDEGIQRGNINANLLDYSLWERFEETETGIFRCFAARGENIYTLAGSFDVAVLEDTLWTTLGLNADERLVDLLTVGDQVYVLGQQSVYALAGSTLEPFMSLPLAQEANGFIYNSGFWVADGKNGLINPEGRPAIPNGPLSDQITRLSFTEQNLYALYGPANMYTDDTDSLGYSYFDNFAWHNETIEGFYNITDAEYFNGSLYFSSAGYGLYNQTTGEHIDHTNSALANGWTGRGPYITELAKKSHLYVLAYDTISSLYTLDQTNQLTPYAVNYVGTHAPERVQISGSSILWITRHIQAGGGIITLDVQNDDFRLLTTANGLPSATVQGLAIDHNDNAWIATPNGPAIYSNASFPFDNFNAIRPIFENRELFEEEDISAIMVDGGNRIWISTGTGIYVFNDILTELIEHFNTRNSPLPANRVSQFAYNPSSGEMYILTERGLVSYRTHSSVGRQSHQEVRIFPNPVRPGYSGLIGISGLARDVSVKITDINGKLIRHLDANGGSAAWDLLDYNRQRVNSGVYVILSSSADGTETYVGKLAVVN